MLLNRRSAFVLGAALLQSKAMSQTVRKLSWDDLISQDSELDFEKMLSCWPRLAVGRTRPIGLSALGCCFLERPDGSVYALDPLLGEFRKVAVSMDDFGRGMNSPEWQQRNLHRDVVAQILERGLTRNSRQVFGFSPHPKFGGELDASRAITLDPAVWHSISSQSF